MLRALVLSCIVGCGSAPAPSTSPANRMTEQAREGVQYVGDPNARVRIDYYFDYECSHCIHFSSTIDEIEQRYGDRIVVHYKNFQFAKHPNARMAAISVEAARRQGQFLAMHRLVFERMADQQERLMAALARGESIDSTLTPEEMRRDAAKLGLDLARYDADVQDPTAAARVDSEYADGEKRGVDRVPVIFINDVMYGGEPSTDGIAAAIDPRL